ncbi:MAG: hypothetical protein MJ192_03585 [Clostridia bacterium]|nr:hypothetical protein [Clostridia bacterium]
MDVESTVAMPTENTNTGLGTGFGWVCPDFKVSGIFSSHMVLQQNKPIRVWGFCARVGTVVTGTFMGETVTTVVPEDNKWVLTFSPRPYECEGQVMTITDGAHPDAPVVFEDVLIGDVWLIGGQSNAELTLAPCLSMTPSVEFYEGDNFRLFTQTQAYPYTHQEMCEYPQPDIINPEWCWKRPDEAASRAFSAMGWYFAKEMIKHISIPLGMVMMCAGGACVRELIPEELAHIQGYTAGANVKEGGYYNTLIHPLEGLQFKAQMFFQGESEGLDRALAEKYDYELALLVADERQRFGCEFPFYNVQLSSYRQEGSDVFFWLDIIRMKQFDAVRLIPESNLTVDMDLGAPDDYPDWPHSPRKLELAERLARLALAREYGIGNERDESSPWPVQAFLSADSKTIRIDFNNVNQGLIVSGHAPADSIGMEVQGFSVGDYDHRVPAKAVITGRGTVTVDVPEDASDLSHVNYAYFKIVTPENADLRCGNNLPAPAFSLKLS